MSKLLLVTFVALIAAICIVSAGPGCSKAGGTCNASLGSYTCCMGLVCNIKNLKCDVYVGPAKTPTLRPREGRNYKGGDKNGRG